MKRALMLGAILSSGSGGPSRTFPKNHLVCTYLPHGCTVKSVTSRVSRALDLVHNGRGVLLVLDFSLFKAVLPSPCQK